MNKVDTKYKNDTLETDLYPPEKDVNSIFNWAYDKFSARLFTFAKYMLYNKSDAEDILQETYIIFYNSLKNNTVINQPKAYLFSVIRRLCLKKNRDNKVYSPIDENIESMDKTELSNNMELYELILGALPLLDEKYREAYILREIQGLDYDEVASILDITQSGARSRVARAIARLKEILKPIINEFEKYN